MFSKKNNSFKLNHFGITYSFKSKSIILFFQLWESRSAVGIADQNACLRQIKIGKFLPTHFILSFQWNFFSDGKNLVKYHIDLSKFLKAQIYILKKGFKNLLNEKIHTWKLHIPFMVFAMYNQTRSLKHV